MAKIRKRGNSYQIDYFDPNGKRIRKSFKKRKDVRDWGRIFICHLFYAAETRRQTSQTRRTRGTVMYLCVAIGRAI